MILKNISKNIPQTTWKLQTNVVADGSVLTGHKPVFTHDSKYFLLPHNNKIVVYNSLTGLIVQELKHKAKVVTVALDPNDTTIVVSCDILGNLIRWNIWKNSFQEADIITGQLDGTSYVSSLFLGKTNTYVLLDNCELWLLEPTPSNSRLLKRIVCTTELKIQFCPTRELFVYSNDLFTFKVYYPADNREKFIKQKKVLCLAIHPVEEIIAAGNNYGQILVWFRIWDDHVKCSEYHWHVAEVADITFSSLGNFLFSIGCEGVLVKYDLLHNDRQFLRGLASGGLSLSSDRSDKYVISFHVDKSLLLTDVQQWKLTGSIIQLSSSVKAFGLLPSHATSEVVFAAKTGHIQFFDPSHKRVTYMLDISASNMLPKLPELKAKESPNTEIEHACISANGEWLVTVESCWITNDLLDADVKFWKFNKKMQQWQLNTCSHTPHGDQITALSIHQSNTSKPTVITCSKDKTFKLWQLISVAHGEDRRSYFICCTTQEYQGKIPAASAFSPDGSVIAITFENVVTLWTQDSISSVRLITSLHSSTIKPEPIHQVVFSEGDQPGAMIMSQSNSCLASWSLFSVSLLWHVIIRTSCLCSDSMSGIMAAFTYQNEAFFFYPRDPAPVLKFRLDIENPVMFAVFVKSSLPESNNCPWGNSSLLFVMDNKQVLYEIREKDDSPPEVLPSMTKMLKEHKHSKLSITLSHLQQAALTRQKSVTVPHYTTLPESQIIKKLLSESYLAHLDSFATLGMNLCSDMIPPPLEVEVPKEAAVSYSLNDDDDREDNPEEILPLRAPQKIVHLVKKLDFNAFFKTDI